MSMQHLDYDIRYIMLNAWSATKIPYVQFKVRNTRTYVQLLQCISILHISGIYSTMDQYQYLRTQREAVEPPMRANSCQ